MSHEVEPKTSWRSLAATVVGTLGCLAAVNLALVWYLPRFGPNKANWLVRHKWQLAATSPDSVDAVIVGDSTAHQNIDTTRWEQTTGYTTRNLGTVADLTPAHSVWILRRLAGNSRLPPRIVFMHTYDGWHRNVNPAILAHAPVELDGLKSLDPPIKLSWGGKARFLSHRYLPLVTNNQSLQYLIEHRLHTPRDWWRSEFSMDDNGQEIAGDLDNEQLQRDLARHIAFVNDQQRTGFRPSRVADTALKSLAALASNNDVEIFVITSPVVHDLRQEPAFQMYRQGLEDYLVTACGTSSRLHYVRVGGEFSADEMENADHLLPTAARRFTDALIRALPEIAADDPVE